VIESSPTASSDDANEDDVRDDPVLGSRIFSLLLFEELLTFVLDLPVYRNMIYKSIIKSNKEKLILTTTHFNHN
jgi:hypothetical protein